MQKRGKQMDSIEKTIIFNDGDGNTLAVLKIKNWDNMFGAVVAEAKDKWPKAGNELIDMIKFHIHAKGYEYQSLDFEELNI